MKSSRAGLLALAFGILLGLFLSVASYDVSYAQAQAPAAAPAAAPATPPAPPPACANDPDPKKAVLEKCTPNSGDTAWMLTSVALVLMMTIPGLGLFYGGMVRKKNVGDTVMTSFAVTCLRHHSLRGHHLQSRLYAAARHSSAEPHARSCRES